MKFLESAAPVLFGAGVEEAVHLEKPLFSALDRANADWHVPRIPHTVAYDPGAAWVGEGRVREETEDRIPPLQKENMTLSSETTCRQRWR